MVPPSPQNSTIAPDALAGRIIVVTGGSDGVGRAAVRAFVRAGATVYLVGRNEAKSHAAASAIMSETGRRTVNVEIADLSLQDDVKKLARRLRTRLAHVDCLVNNAGALYLERGETREGLERTFALNHLAYFSLTLLLLDRLVATPHAPARIINVASRAHRNARLVLNDLQLTTGYGGWRAYRNSKLCNILFTRALANRVPQELAVVYAMHPGLVSTRFAVNNGQRGRLWRRIMDLRSISPEQGADTIAWLAASDEAIASTGEYWVRRKPVLPSRMARNDKTAELLWNASADLTGLDADVIVREAVDR